MTNEQRKELDFLKREINQPKGQLIDLLRRIEALSPAQADKLGRILAKLEAFQCTK